MDLIESEFEFSENLDHTLAVSLYKGDGFRVLIPLMYKGKKVTQIGHDAFKGNKRIVEVNLMDHVTEISKSAFEGCTNLRTVSGAKKLKDICKKAFKDCKKLEELPAKGKPLCYIGPNAFEGCDSLKYIEIFSKKRIIICDKAFAGCKNLHFLSIKCKFLAIGKFAFADCSSLTGAAVHSSVTKIEEGCFYKCENLYYAALSYLDCLEDLNFRYCPKLKQITLFCHTDINLGLNCFPINDDGTYPDVKIDYSVINLLPLDYNQFNHYIGKYKVTNTKEVLPL